MADSFEKQFKNLKLLIDSNIDSINLLVKQAEGLSKMINEMKDSEPDGQKDGLAGIRDSLVDIINELIGKTKKLFDAYDKLHSKIS